MRSDLALIADLIRPNARVLDLGCGDGELLAELAATKQVNGYGLDVDADNIRRCLERGVNVIEQDLNLGLDNFADDSFDMVVMTETLQSVHNPSDMVDAMLRIARECIVTFPNFGHWRCRAHLLLRGSMPVAKHLPHDWFNTPNIHLCTFKDFERLCHDKRLNIIERLVIDAKSNDANSTPRKRPAANLFGATAFYHLGR
ncbi:MAG: methionine biosynthesis protein MetW [Pseudomonadaceae bacterium]|nr:methionine biosynthesis protein MetW [Pseudomonadaceae bacterium]